MGHTPIFRKLLLTLQAAREKNFENLNRPMPISYQKYKCSRRKFINGAAKVGAATLLASKLSSCGGGGSSGETTETKVAIIGAGIAGLNAAYHLKKAGLLAKVYDASDRVGGRILSLVWNSQFVVDFGGELINTDHKDMLDLAEELDVTLFNRIEDINKANLPKTIYYFENEKISEDVLAIELIEIVDQISADAELLDEDWDTHAPLFDKMSVEDYLTKHASKLSKPYLKKLFEEMIRTEYGAELSDSSALQLLFMLPTIDGLAVNLLGYSDETYSVMGGSSQITNALHTKIGNSVVLQSALKKIEKQGNKYVLSFKNRSTVLAEYVILAMPFTALKDVEIDAGLSKEFSDFIQQSTLGVNEKVFSPFKSRFWRKSEGFTEGIWCDKDYSQVWDATLRQNTATAGILNFYLGGKKVEPLNKTLNMTTIGVILVNALNTIVSGANDADAYKYFKSDWLNNEYIKGAYSNYKPGVLTKYGEFFWVESDNEEEKQEVRVDNLFFIGEHLSDEFYGFMNGGAQTGRLAAEALVAELLANNT